MGNTCGCSSEGLSDANSASLSKLSYSVSQQWSMHMMRTFDRESEIPHRSRHHSKKNLESNSMKPKTSKKSQSPPRKRFPEEKETVIKEGSMLKQTACPNATSSGAYVSRWVQLTENRLRYYKN